MPFTPEIAIVLSLLAIAGILFAFDKIPAEVVALTLALSLVLFGVIESKQAFAGYGSDTVVMIFGLLVLTAGLERTGVVDIAGRFLIRCCRDNSHLLLSMVMITAAALSAFISNTAATAFFLPIVFGAAMRQGESPSRYLMPLAFASILASSITLISTSTNLVVNELAVRRGMKPIGFFELAPVGIPIAIIGMLYMRYIGRWLIKERAPAELDYLGLRAWLTEALVTPDSNLVGKTIAEADLGSKLDLRIIRLIRGKKYFAPRPNLVIDANDSLILEGLRDEILKIKEITGLKLKPDASLVDPEIDSEEVTLAEGIVMPNSILIGRNLKSMQFGNRYDVQVLAIARAETVVRERLSEVHLQTGDMLLIQGPEPALKIMASDGNVHLLGRVEESSPAFRRAPLSLAIFAVSLLIGGLKLVPFSLATSLGAVAMFLTNCITPDEAFRQIQWRLVLLIGAMLAVGPAMEQSGTASFLAGAIAHSTAQYSPVFILAAFFGLTLVLTQVMSNQGAAVVVLPVAVQTASQLHLNPRAFVMTIALAASCSYLTPLEPACLLVYGPGRYKFFDFFKVGIGLTAIIFALTMTLVPLLWPIHP